MMSSSVHAPVPSPTQKQLDTARDVADSGGQDLVLEQQRAAQLEARREGGRAARSKRNSARKAARLSAASLLRPSRSCSLPPPPQLELDRLKKAGEEASGAWAAEKAALVKSLSDTDAEMDKLKGELAQAVARWGPRATGPIRRRRRTHSCGCPVRHTTAARHLSPSALALPLSSVLAPGPAFLSRRVSCVQNEAAELKTVAEEYEKGSRRPPGSKDSVLAAQQVHVLNEQLAAKERQLTAKDRQLTALKAEREELSARAEEAERRGRPAGPSEEMMDRVDLAERTVAALKRERDELMARLQEGSTVGKVAGKSIAEKLAVRPRKRATGAGEGAAVPGGSSAVCSQPGMSRASPVEKALKVRALMPSDRAGRPQEERADQAETAADTLRKERTELRKKARARSLRCDSLLRALAVIPLRQGCASVASPRSVPRFYPSDGLRGRRWMSLRPAWRLLRRTPLGRWTRACPRRSGARTSLSASSLRSRRAGQSARHRCRASKRATAVMRVTVPIERTSPNRLPPAPI